jgi:hypothetical protein
LDFNVELFINLSFKSTTVNKLTLPDLIDILDLFVSFPKYFRDLIGDTNPD